ncbi:hypothetical protein LUZ60_013744 [Juncus effusus]|nr:hypothetical protein LUZ60_013744 [Juncus effusus]
MNLVKSLPWPFRKRTDGGDLTKEIDNSRKNSKGKESEKEEEEELGITDSLIEFVKTFTVEIFKSYPLSQDDRSADSDRNKGGESLRSDLSEWQEKHAICILSKNKEIAKLRYNLCPKHMKERRFWTIYFLLVKNHIAPYEIRAIQKAKLKSMENNGENSKKNNAIELEMTESNCNSLSTNESDFDLESQIK